MRKFYLEILIYKKYLSNEIIDIVTYYDNINEIYLDYLNYDDYADLSALDSVDYYVCKRNDYILEKVKECV